MITNERFFAISYALLSNLAKLLKMGEIKSFFSIFLIISFTIYALSGLALGYLASYFLLRTVAYLSPWLPVWMWYGDIGLFLHAVSIASTSTVGVIAVLANKGHALKLCSYILTSLLIVEILATVQLATRSYSLDRALYVDLNDSMITSQQYYSYNISDTQMWDEIQLEVNCCGVISYDDWFATKFSNESSVPDSCCLMVTKGCGANIASNPNPGDEIILNGCLPTIMSSVRTDFDYYGHSVWLPVVVIQTILILMIFYLISKTRMERSYYPYILSPSLLSRDSSPKYETLEDPYI